MKNERNIQMLEIVAKGLGALLEDVVFVGGATTALYISDPAAPESRPTDDVDCVVDITTRVEYGKLEKKLEKLGFRHYTKAPTSPICRWEFQNITVDVMPTDSSVLGFTNKWYKEGIEKSTTQKLPSGQSINVFSLPYFLASKLEAFKGRGRGDYRGSSDIEDIITIFDGNPDVTKLIQDSPLTVRSYLVSSFKSIVSDNAFIEGIYAHLPFGNSGNRADSILKEIQIVSNLS